MKSHEKRREESGEKKKDMLEQCRDGIVYVNRLLDSVPYSNLKEQRRD